MLAYQTSSVSTTSEQGLYIAAVSYNNDFRVGDRIVAINSSEVATCGQMRDILGTCQVGDVVGVTVMRDGEPLDLSVTLTETDMPTGTAAPAA